MRTPRRESTTPIAEIALGRFVEAVCKDSALEQVGVKLKKTLLVDGDASETALRRAMFGDGT